MGGGTVTRARQLTVRDPRVATRVPGETVPGGIAQADPAPGPASAPPAGFRPDIQGLRALAVALVVVYHLYPTLVPGGFAGVDIFFVISGFLITGHLWRDYQKAGTVSLVDFWGRRARRLMPAAAVVLAITWAGSLLLLPRAQLEDAAAQVRASALYFQNWQLAHDAVDYLKSADAASPVQHFWSLSVEEQFYLFWPLLFIAAVPVSWLASRRARQRAQSGGRHRAARPAAGLPREAAYGFIGCLTTALVLASLAYSGYETKVNPPAAYFVTTTRIWELGAGGLLALLSAPLAEKLGRLGWLAWVGLAMAVSSAFVLHGTTAFPGLIALLPVTGAALLIACGRGPGGTARLMSLRPLVFIGGISYSLYLWHWPVFTLWASWRGHKIGALDGPLLVLLSVLLAWLTKVAVEDRVREARLLARHRWRSLSTALAVVVPVALVSGYLITKAPDWGGNLGPGYPGAAALAGTAGAVGHRPVLPPPDSTATTLEPKYWKQGCLVSQPSAVPKACAFGDTVNPRLTVVLAGDSIAGNWFPALDQIATQEHWELITELHGNCMLTDTMMFQSTTDSAFTACHQWGTAVMRDLLTTIHPDVVIASGRYADKTYDHHDIGPAARADIGAGMATDWKQLEQHGIPVVAIRETPELASGAPTCILRHPDHYASCARPVATATVRDSPIWYAARDMAATGAAAVPVVDMDDLICGPRSCDPVVGNVLVFFDTHHMTESYAQTLAPFLRARLLTASPVLRAAA